jgi:nucleoside-diphosphate-sugar epimerase
VLMAGSSGAIGRHLIPQLIAAKHEVIGITRRPGSLEGTGAREIVADVLDRAALFSALDGVTADAVVHQATALTKAPARYRDMRETNRLRAEGTATLIAAARMIGAKKFVAASFFAGYGLRDLGREPLAETAPFGESDERNDAVLLALRTLELQVRAFGGVSLRYGLFYDDTTTAVSPVSRIWNGLIPNLHLKDAARAVVLALAKYKPGAVYNVADEVPMTYRDREIARAKAAGIRAPQQLPDALIRLGAPFGSMLLTRENITLDTSKVRAELGWKPEFPSLFGATPRLEPLVPVEPDREIEPVVEVESEPVVESQVAPEPDPEPELAPEPDPVAEPAAEPIARTQPKPRAQRAPTKPRPTTKPVPRAHKVDPAIDPEPADNRDPFRTSDAAIAKIGSKHGD